MFVRVLAQAHSVLAENKLLSDAGLLRDNSHLHPVERSLGFASRSGGQKQPTETPHVGD